MSVAKNAKRKVVQIMLKFTARGRLYFVKPIVDIDEDIVRWYLLDASKAIIGECKLSNIFELLNLSDNERFEAVKTLEGV